MRFSDKAQAFADAIGRMPTHEIVRWIVTSMVDQPRFMFHVLELDEYQVQMLALGTRDVLNSCQASDLRGVVQMLEIALDHRVPIAIPYPPSSGCS